MEPRWRIELFGGVRARQGDRTLAIFRTQKTGLLLGYLAYYHRQAHPREELVDLLWPESEPRAARNNLSVAMAWLRRQLEPEGAPAGAVLVADRASVRLNPEAVSTDLMAFETSLRAASRVQDRAERVSWLTQAVRLYRGDLLRGYHEAWVLREREAVGERYFAALGHLIADLEQMGDLDSALDAARRAVSADPLREERQRDLIRLLAATGQPEAALRQCRDLERVLQEELGAVPTSTTRALVRKIEATNDRRPTTTSSDRGPTPSEDPPLRSKRAAVPDARITDREPPASLDPEPKSVVGRWSLVGERSEPEGENRVVTILFADMSGSVEQTAELHPEDAAALVDPVLRAMVAAIERYEGWVDRFLGDGVLAVFGVPHAHEDDPERAIRAAIAIREAAGQIGAEVSAGINTGEVYFGVVGSESHPEKTVIGRVVNVAARLQEEAAPGEILVGPSTGRLARGAFDFSSRSLMLRGIREPVAVYAMESPLTRPEKSRGIEGLRAELIGRDKELTVLKEAFAELLAGRGQIVSIIGEAGVGKSRLVSELKLAALGSGLWALGEEVPSFRAQSPEPRAAAKPLWLEGRCLELGQRTAYALFVDLLRDTFAWGPEEDAQDRGVRLVACLEDLVARGHLTGEQADQIGPLLGSLLALRFGNDWDLRLKNADPEQIKHQTFLALRDFFAALSAAQPLVLVLEDLHWADRFSLDVISLLMDALSSAPLLLLCLYRPERGHDCWRLGTIASQKCPECATELVLRDLTPAQSRRLVDSLLAAETLPEAVKSLILEKARGNPFFVEEVIHSLIDAGLLYRDGEAWRAREGIQTVTVPESVQSVILSRVDPLAPELKRLLESAAVIGRLFRRRWLEQVVAEAGVDAESRRLDPLLRELEERALIYRERTVPEEEYSFRHVLVQETVYRSLRRQRRAALHERAGAVIETLHPEQLEEQYERLAHHYERGEQQEKAIEYLLKAGEKTRRAYLNPEAVGYFQRALERLDHRPPTVQHRARKLDALKGLGLTYHGMGKIHDAEECFRAAIALGRELRLPPRDLVRIYYWLGYMLNRQSRSQESIRIGEEGLALLGEDTETSEAAMMNAVAAAGYDMSGNYPKCEDLNLRNARFLDSLPYMEELRWAYANVAEVYAIRKNLAEARRWLELLERLARQHQDQRGLAEFHFRMAGNILNPQGDLRGAIRHLEQAVDLMKRIGDDKLAARCLFRSGSNHWCLGELTEAEERARTALRLLEGAGARGDELDIQSQTAVLMLCRASSATAAEMLREVAQGFDAIGAPYGRAWSTQAAGWAELASGRLDAARQLFESFLEHVAHPCALADALAGLERSLEDPELVRAFRRRFHEAHPGLSLEPFTHWFLEPACPRRFTHRAAFENFAARPTSHWSWLDPLGDCRCSVGDGVEIRAANARDLCHLNRSAPRLLRSVPDDPSAGSDQAFAVQVLCLPVNEAPGTEPAPAIGGLLLWKDEENYLRLEKGTRGAHEISFAGCLGGEDNVFGRGWLPSSETLLRLERDGSRVTALCSADGQEWYTAGEVEFAFNAPVQIGLHAIGSIDRLCYPGAYPLGTAIRFERFELWTAQAKNEPSA